MLLVQASREDTQGELRFINIENATQINFTQEQIGWGEPPKFLDVAKIYFSYSAGSTEEGTSADYWTVYNPKTIRQLKDYCAALAATSYIDMWQIAENQRILGNI